MEITNIPRRDIDLFLSKNKIRSQNDPYGEAWKLIEKGADFYPDSVIEWMMAYNLINSKKNIRKYTPNEVIFMSEIDLRKLAQLLDMKTINISHMINILTYAHKLNDLDKYPKESLLEMRDLLNKMNYRQIISYCSNKKNKLHNLCELPEVMDIIREKSTEMEIDRNTLNMDEFMFMLYKVFPPTWEGYFKK